MRVFKNRAEAEAAGCFVASACYPWTAYSRTTPPEAVGEVRTDLEAQLADALEACLREHGGFTIKGDCERNAQAALRAFRGEGSTS